MEKAVKGHMEGCCPDVTSSHSIFPVSPFSLACNDDLVHGRRFHYTSSFYDNTTVELNTNYDAIA